MAQRDIDSSFKEFDDHEPDLGRLCLGVYLGRGIPLRVEFSIATGKKLGIERYWRELDAQNAARVIAFLDDAYGIFYLSEIFTLLKAEIVELHPKARSLDQLKSHFHLE